MKAKKREKRLLNLVYLLCLLLFTALGFLQQPFDKFALIMGVVLCVLIGYSHFIVRRFYPDGDKFILIFASVLAVVGVAMLYRINPNTAIKQLIWIALGIIGYILIVVILPDLKSFAKYKNVYMIITLVLMPLALIFGTEQFGAKNWILIGPISFQPSEFAKIALVLYLAAALATYESKKSFKEEVKQLFQPALVAGFSMGCMVLQRDLGSALIFFGISITLLYGVGLGQGHFQNLPVKESDMIYAIICEEFGIIFAIGLMIIYFLLFYRGIRAAFVTKDSYSQLIAVGFSTMIACQTLVIIGGIFSVIPLTGITLPIISYGGSSVLTIFFALGILQKISEEA